MKVIKTLVKKYMPKRLLRIIMGKYFEREGRRLAKEYQGDNVTCPCCNSSFKSFMDFEISEINNESRYSDYYKNTLCPRCFSFPRHRIVCDYFNRNKNFFSNKPNILMFGAEYSIEKWFRNHDLLYTKADLFDRTAEIKVDILNTPFADNSWSIIICNHVLEHVPDYKLALKELKRILKKDGFLELAVPTDKNFNTTYEDDSIVTSEQRVEFFGQADHLRVFGNDFQGLLIEAGFKVEVVNGDDLPEKYRCVVGPANYDDNRIYICRK